MAITLEMVREAHSRFLNDLKQIETDGYMDGYDIVFEDDDGESKMYDAHTDEFTFTFFVDDETGRIEPSSHVFVYEWMESTDV